mgnify:CR=1 FL=1
MSRETIQQLQEKKTEVLKAIKPICEAFNLEYDYIVKETGQTETLVLNGQKIGCSCNSAEATINEVIGYIFVKIYCRKRYIGAFRTQTLNVIKQYWIK